MYRRRLLIFLTEKDFGLTYKLNCYNSDEVDK